ncbi:hypothetical protein VCHA53O466_140189 [Vibrio chagasii]|nr:hypothetical protein VCHA53O466_140189 [Vibrio chagasii]
MDAKLVSDVSQLKVGSIVREEHEADSYCVTAINGVLVSAVRTFHITNTNEWAFESGGDVVSLDSIERGDIIVSKYDGLQVVVTANYSGYCFGVRNVLFSDLTGLLLFN